MKGPPWHYMKCSVPCEYAKNSSQLEDDGENVSMIMLSLRIWHPICLTSNIQECWCGPVRSVGILIVYNFSYHKFYTFSEFFVVLVECSLAHVSKVHVAIKRSKIKFAYKKMCVHLLGVGFGSILMFSQC